MQSLIVALLIYVTCICYYSLKLNRSIIGKLLIFFNSKVARKKISSNWKRRKLFWRPLFLWLKFIFKTMLCLFSRWYFFMTNVTTILFEKYFIEDWNFLTFFKIIHLKKTFNKTSVKFRPQAHFRVLTLNEIGISSPSRLTELGRSPLF